MQAHFWGISGIECLNLGNFSLPGAALRGASSWNIPRQDVSSPYGNNAVDRSAHFKKNTLPQAAEAIRLELHRQNGWLHCAKLDTARYLRMLWDLHNP